MPTRKQRIKEMQDYIAYGEAAMVRHAKKGDLRQMSFTQTLIDMKKEELFTAMMKELGKDDAGSATWFTNRKPCPF